MVKIRSNQWFYKDTTLASEWLAKRLVERLHYSRKPTSRRQREYRLRPRCLHYARYPDFGAVETITYAESKELHHSTTFPMVRLTKLYRAIGHIELDRTKHAIIAALEARGPVLANQPQAEVLRRGDPYGS